MLKFCLVFSSKKLQLGEVCVWLKIIVWLEEFIYLIIYLFLYFLLIWIMYKIHLDKVGEECDVGVHD